jgi:hypothetical protein
MNSGCTDTNEITNDPSRHYINPETLERVPVTYQVHLSMPAYYDGFIEVQAFSEEEAAKLALSAEWADVDWQQDKGDPQSIEVVYVECEDPPAGAMLVSGGADHEQG